MHVALATELCDLTKPVFIVQLDACDPADEIEERLRNEPLEFADRLPLEDRPDLLPAGRDALLQYQFPRLFKQRALGLLVLTSERVHPLRSSQLCQLAIRQPQESAHLLVNIRPIRCRR